VVELVVVLEEDVLVQEVELLVVELVLDE